MKKTTMKMLGSLAIAAALAMTTGLTACSSENELTETPSAEQPALPTAKGVKVTVTAEIADPTPSPSPAREGSGAQTRSAVTKDGTTRTLKFTGPKGTEGDADYEPGDRLYIHGEIYDNHPQSDGYDPTKDEAETVLYGYLDIDPESISADGTTASFSGTLHTEDLYNHAEDAYDFHGGDPLAACNFTENEGYGEPAHAILVHSGTKAGSYTIDNGAGFFYKTDDMFADDVETLMTTALYVMGRYDKQTQGFTLSAECPILNCTLSGLDANHDYTATLATNSYGSNYSNITYNIQTDADGACAFAISTYLVGSKHRYITIKDGETEVGTIDLGTKDMTARVYNVTRVWTGLCFAKSVSGEVDLSEVTYNILAQNGTTLSGSLGAGYKVTIAEGATVTFSDMTVGPTDEYSDDEYPGIDCAGNATINLVGKNIVEVNKRGDAGIFVPSGSTLTIESNEGTGSLEAYGGFVINSYHGAGIGGGDGIACGHIVINSGTVTAVGQSDCAGIGSGRHGSCGNITINGGTVTASDGGEAAGIGSGQNGSCGNITIKGGTVTATGRDNAAGIGGGNEGSCGDIAIATSITSVKATRVVGDEEGYKPLPIGFGKNHQGSGSVTFGNRDMIFWGDLESIVNDDEYGGIHIEVSNDGDVWTLTPAP